MTTRKTATSVHIVDVSGQPHATNLGDSIPTIPFSVVVDVARMGVQAGIGLVAMAFDQAQKVVFLAIDRGAKIEKEVITDLKAFESEQVASMKDYLKKVPGVGATKSVSMEAHVEEALKTFDVPTRDDIRGLEHKIDELTAAMKPRRRS